MIPIYSHEGQLMVALQKEDLIKSSETVKSIISNSLPNSEHILLLDSKYKSLGLAGQVTEGGSDLKLGIILPKGQTTMQLEPIRFFIKKTDKRGAIIKGHPFVTVDELTKLIFEAFQIPEASQELHFQGMQLSDPSQTLLQLKVKDNSVIHVLDLRMVHFDPQRRYSIQLQGSKYPSKTVTVQVLGGMKLKQLKEKAVEIFGIPLESVAVAYLSGVLQEDDYAISYFNVVENSQVKILDEREAIVERIKKQDVEPHNLRVAMHKTSSKDSKRVAPSYKIQRTDSVEWFSYRMFSQASMHSQEGSNIQDAPNPPRITESHSVFEESQGFKSKYREVALEIHQSKSEAASDDGRPHGKEKREKKQFGSQEELIEDEKASGRASAGSEQQNSPTSEIPQASTPSYRVHSAPRPKHTAKIQQFQVDVQDLEGNHFKVSICEIDTIRDVKIKLFFVNPDTPPESQVLIYDGKLLEDDQVVKDIANSQITSLFLMNKEVQ